MSSPEKKSLSSRSGVVPSLRDRYNSLVQSESTTLVRKVALPFTCITVPALTFIFLSPFLFNGPQIAQRGCQAHFLDLCPCEIQKEPVVLVPSNSTIFGTWPIMDAHGDDIKRQQQMPKYFFFGGLGLGSVLFGLISDAFHNHRKLVINVGACWLLLSAMACSVSQSLVAFNILWTVAGVAIFGIYCSQYAYAVETLPDSLRLIMVIPLSKAGWLFSKVISNGFGFMMSDWRAAIICCAMFLCSGAFIYQFLTRRRPNEPRGERISQDPLPPPLKQAFQLSGVWTVLKMPRSLFQLLVLWSAWFLCGFLYWGLEFSSNALHHSSVVGRVLSDVTREGLAVLIAAGACVATKRTLAPFFCFMLLNGICSFIMAGFVQSCPTISYESQDHQWNSPLLLLSMLSFFIISGAWCILWYITAISFPSKARATFLGLCSCVGRLGAICGIYMSDMELIYTSKSNLVILGILSVTFGLVILFFIPERATQPLLIEWQPQPDQTSPADNQAEDIEQSANQASEQP